MNIILKIIGAFMLVINLAACASVVPLPDLPIDPKTNSITLSSINRRIKCELWETMYIKPRNFDILTDFNYEAVMQLSLTVAQGGSIAPNLTYIESPMLSANFGANYNRTRTQNYFQTLFFSMRRIDQEYKELVRNDPNFLGKYCPKEDTNLAGNLGLKETVELSMTAPQNLKVDGLTLSSTVGAFGGSVEFVENKNLNMVGPTWMLRHFRGPGSLAGVTGGNTDKITFAFARGKKTPGFYAGEIPGRNDDAERLLQQINLNQLTTQLGALGIALR